MLNFILNHNDSFHHTRLDCLLIVKKVLRSLITSPEATDAASIELAARGREFAAAAGRKLRVVSISSNTLETAVTMEETLTGDIVPGGLLLAENGPNVVTSNGMEVGPLAGSSLGASVLPQLACRT